MSVFYALNLFYLMCILSHCIDSFVVILSLCFVYSVCKSVCVCHAINKCNLLTYLLKWPPAAAAVAVAMLRLFCYVLHMNFSSTPTSILNLTISQESHSYAEFFDIFRVGKYCQLFTHESKIDQYHDQYAISPFKRTELRFRKKLKTMPETAPSP